MPKRLGLTRDGRLLFGGRALRTFGLGYLSVILPLYLAGSGLTGPEFGAVLTGTLIEDALATTFLSAVADRVGRRRILALTPLLITLAGAILAVAKQPWLLMAAAVVGTLSPGGQEAGPFAPLEQAAIPDTVRREVRTRAFAWYNIFGSSTGSICAMARARSCWGRSSSGPTCLPPSRFWPRHTWRSASACSTRWCSRTSPRTCS